MHKDSNFFNQLPISENQEILLPELKRKKVRLFLKREDSIHPYISGNKFRKLKYNIAKAQDEGQHTLLTFGGAFSNHILATAVAAHKSGFKSIGVIRGEELGDDIQHTLNTNFTLRKAAEYGMQFEFVSRSVYRMKTETKLISELQKKYGQFYLIPEGGTNTWAVKGCEEILSKKDDAFDVICAAMGTGGTLAGLINQSKVHQFVLGFPALKGNFLAEEVSKYVHKTNWKIISDYHFGGYAKYTEDFIIFLNKFTQKSTILLDPIYTGKMIYGILDMVRKDYFSEGSKILAIHTGGIQGIKGFNKKLANKNQQLIQVI